MKHLRRKRNSAGVALLMVIVTIALLATVLIEFSGTARTHLNAGINIRDEVRATTMADTALVMTRACLDPKAWGPLAAMQSKVDLDKLCNMMLGIFIRGRIDLPIGGLSVEMEGLDGVGMSSGDVEDLKLTPEEAYLGLAGLHCPTRGKPNCSIRLSTIRRLRALLCDPSISVVFEKEQSDGHRYTREEVVGNLIDWIDADDNRISIDPLTWNISEGIGEGEDSYLKDGVERYRSKDAPFDSIEELRLVRGVNDELFNFLKDKVSVHSAGKVNINAVDETVLAAMLRSESKFANNLEASACGEDLVPGSGADQLENLFRSYARIILAYRSIRQINAMMGKAFKSGRKFEAVARDPLTALERESGKGVASLLNGGSTPERQAMLMRFGLTEPLYEALRQEFSKTRFKHMVRTDNSLFRLQVRGRVGNMTRQMFAILKREGAVVRTLYYREE